jgi:hypothetical protein
MARRCREVKFVACHPGVSSTNLFRYKYGWARCFMQSQEDGALGSLRAATDPSAKSGETYYGPRGWRGAAVELPMPSAWVTDAETAGRCFAAAAKATGIYI